MEKDELKREIDTPELISSKKVSRSKLMSYYRGLSKRREVIKSNGKPSVGGISVVVGALLVLFGAFFVGEKFGWYDVVTSEPKLLTSAVLIVAGLGLILFGHSIFRVLFSLLFIIFILGGLVWLVGGNTVAGLFLAGNVALEEREIGYFSSLVASGRGSIYLAEGIETSLVLEGDQRLMSHISSEIHEGVLTIRYDGALWKFLSYLYSDLNIYLTINDINSIELKGAYSLETKDVINSSSLTIAVAGSLETNMNIDVSSLRVDINGSGDLITRGRATAQVLDITGRVRYDARNLESDTVFVAVSGSGDIKVRVREELNISGAGSINLGFVGEPIIKQNDISGSGHIYKITEN